MYKYLSCISSTYTLHFIIFFLISRRLFLRKAIHLKGFLIPALSFHLTFTPPTPLSTSSFSLFPSIFLCHSPASYSPLPSSFLQLFYITLQHLTLLFLPLSLYSFSQYFISSFPPSLLLSLPPSGRVIKSP